MPLSAPARRTPLHARKIAIDGYVRDDGKWEIEGRIVDNRAYAFHNEWRGRVEPETPLHEMWTRLTLEDDLTIAAIEVATDQSPFAICSEVLPNFQRLVGAKVGVGFAKIVREVVGGKQGCTHIVDMLSQMATVALQTKIPPQARAARDRALGRPVADVGSARSPWADSDSGAGKPPVLDTCYAWSSDGAVVKSLLPRHYTGKA